MSGMYKDVCTLFNKIFLEQLLDMFCKYFLEKKPSMYGWTSSLVTLDIFSWSLFMEFAIVTKSQVKRSSQRHQSNPASLTHLLDECLDWLIPVITRTINDSDWPYTLVADAWCRLLHPLLKKILISKSIIMFRNFFYPNEF